ncbi:hypothetical protein ANTRET_LOCUS2948 [Anthophora retusa]
MLVVFKSSKLCTKDLEIAENTFGLNLSRVSSVPVDFPNPVIPSNRFDFNIESSDVSIESSILCSIAVVQTVTREPMDELTNPCLTVEADGNGQVGKSPLFVPFCVPEFISEFSIVSVRVLIPL